MTRSKTPPEQPARGGSYIRDRKSAKLRQVAATKPAEAGAPPPEQAASDPAPAPTTQSAAATGTASTKEA